MGNLFILISIVFNVVGQTVLKTGVNRLGVLNLDPTSIVKAFSSAFIWGGLVFYAISSVFWILALSYKDLSYAYPMLSVGYLAVVLLSWMILGEELTAVRIIGVALISLGVYLVFRSA